MKSAGVAYLLLLAFFCGLPGFHRFYLGRPASGFLFAITCGGFGLWYFLDLFLIPGMVQEENELFASLFRGGEQTTNVHVDFGNDSRRRDDRNDRDREDAAERKLEKIENARKQEANAKATKVQRLMQLKKDLARAAKFHKDCLDAWQQAGSPNIQQIDLDNAKEAISDCLDHARKTNRKQTFAALKIAYLTLAHFVRQSADQASMPWFVTTLILGTAFFAFAVCFTFLVTNSIATFVGLGGFGFLSGCFVAICLHFVPNNNEVRKGLAAPGQQKADHVDPLEIAKLAFKDAQQKYEQLLSQHRIKTELEKALVDEQELQDEYQVVCDM